MVDIEQLNTTVAVMAKELRMWMDNTCDYRKAQKDYLDKIFNEITSMKNTCFAREPDYVFMKKHLQDFDKQQDRDKKWFMDRKLWVMTSIVAVINILLAFFLNHHSTLAQAVKNGN